MDFTTAAKLKEICETENITIGEAMMRREVLLMGSSETEVRRGLQHAYDIMKQSAAEALEQPGRSMGGLIGGEAKKMNDRLVNGVSLCGSVVGKAITYAMGVLEVNASMGLIVAAPTAGSSGVIPGTFLACQETYDMSDEQMIDGLLCAGAVGYLITHNATVAGAEGGCQAEIGSASAMAAAAIVQLMGGSVGQSFAAASIALSNLMGLVCDPIAGLVEAPCHSRNAIGASNAVISAEIALSGTAFPILLDETIEAMYKVGLSLPRELRETALGGIAAAPSACSMCIMK